MMRYPRVCSCLLTSLCLLFWDIPTTLAATKYVPPSTPSAPKGTVPRVSRGGSCNPEAQGQLTPLAPFSHVGQTVSKRPTVVWYVPDRTSHGLELRLFRANGQRLYRTVLQSQPGLMQFSFPAELPELSVGQYRWQVVLVCNPGIPSLNVVETANIAVVEPTPALKTQLMTSKIPQQQLERYAVNGLWYDALAIAVGNGDSQHDAETINLLNGLASVEASTSKDWSNRLRQVASLIKVRSR